MTRFRNYLSRPVAIHSLVAFRIAFGAILMWDCWRFFKYDRINRYFVEPEFHFTYYGFGWVTPLPEPFIQIAWMTMGFAAFMVMLGLFYRFAIILLTVLFSYFFLLDKAEYLNHFYLVILFAVLMCFLPANRAFSVDARLRPGLRSLHVPYASVFVLRMQMEIMLVFAGLVKLTPDWLAGEPLGLWLRGKADEVPFGWLLHYDWVILAGTWVTIALHVLGAPLLLWKRTRLWVFLIYCCFHMSNAYFFNIGIFPWLTIAATTIFFAPDWPRKLLEWVIWPIEDLPSPHKATRVPVLAVAAIATWMSVQFFLPVRALLFPTEVRWSGDGHRFSWRMRIYDRRAEGVFIVTDPASGAEWIVEPEDFLTRRQAGKMLVRSDMVHQFANYLEDVWKIGGYQDVVVRAEIMKSLNGRPRQYFVDPRVDLTAVPVNLFRPDNWVLPIEVPVWGVADNRPPTS